MRERALAHLSVLQHVSTHNSSRRIYLESSSHTEHTIVCLLWGQTLQGELDLWALLRDQIIGAADASMLATHSFVYRASTAIASCAIHPCAMTYRSPSFRYPALSKYHLLSGAIHFCSHGRFMIYGAREGTDMVGGGYEGSRRRRGWRRLCMLLQVLSQRMS